MRTRKSAITTLSMICSDWNTKNCLGGTEYRLRVASNDHYVTRGFEVSQF